MALDTFERGEIISEIIFTPTEKLKEVVAEHSSTAMSLRHKRDFDGAGTGKKVEVSPEDARTLEIAELYTIAGNEARILRQYGANAPDVNLYEMYGGTPPAPKPEGAEQAL